jgi:hypothetical protein
MEIMLIQIALVVIVIPVLLAWGVGGVAARVAARIVVAVAGLEDAMRPRLAAMGWIVQFGLAGALMGLMGLAMSLPSWPPQYRLRNVAAFLMGTLVLAAIGGRIGAAIHRRSTKGEGGRRTPARLLAYFLVVAALVVCVVIALAWIVILLIKVIV